MNNDSGVNRNDIFALEAPYEYVRPGRKETLACKGDSRAMILREVCTVYTRLSLQIIETKTILRTLD